jgi:hypothetical protein
MDEPRKTVDESWKEEVAREKGETQRGEEKDAAQRPRAAHQGFPPLQATFTSLIAELAMQASLFLGELVDPETEEPIEDLNRAKYLIDELGLLEEKTKGNLAPEEAAALKNVLFDLRMKYVKKTSGK